MSVGAFTKGSNEDATRRRRPRSHHEIIRRPYIDIFFISMLLPLSDAIVRALTPPRSLT